MEGTFFNTEKLKNFIAESTFTDIELIQEDTLIFDEGIFDSLGFLSLISFLNDEYGIEILNEELKEENFESINAISAFITRKRNQ